MYPEWTNFDEYGNDLWVDGGWNTELYYSVIIALVYMLIVEKSDQVDSKLYNVYSRVECSLDFNVSNYRLPIFWWRCNFDVTLTTQCIIRHINHQFFYVKAYDIRRARIRNHSGLPGSWVDRRCDTAAHYWCEPSVTNLLTLIESHTIVMSCVWQAAGTRRPLL